MSVERCLQVVSQKFDHEHDFAGLFEELSELETETLDVENPEDYHGPLGAFLERLEDLFAEEVFEQEVASHAVSNLRTDLESLRDNRAPQDPLEHLFRDMLKFENGSLTSSQVLTTLSRYEELILALRHQFEGSTDPTDQREAPQMMRSGLAALESAGRQLRQLLNNDDDSIFADIRERFEQGTVILQEFRRIANFEAPPEDDEDEWEE